MIAFADPLTPAESVPVLVAMLGFLSLVVRWAMIDRRESRALVASLQRSLDDKDNKFLAALTRMDDRRETQAAAAAAAIAEARAAIDNNTRVVEENTEVLTEFRGALSRWAHEAVGPHDANARTP